MEKIITNGGSNKSITNNNKSYSIGETQNKSVTPTGAQQAVLADNGKILGTVTINGLTEYDGSHTPAS